MDRGEIETEIAGEAAALYPKKGPRDLTTGPVAKTLFAFALPSLGVNIMQSFNNSVNSVWIGRFLGKTALAATGNAGMLMFLMFSTLFGLSMATTVMIGQSMGRRDIEDVRRTLGTAMGMFVIAGTATAVLGWWFTPELLRLLATPKEAYDLAISYSRIMFLGLPFGFVMILLSSSLRGVGDAITPMWATVMNVALDIVLNPLFIIGAGPIPAMGIAGSAFATLLAGLISTAFLLYQIYEKDLTIRLRGHELSWLRPQWAVVKRIISMGFPMGISMIIMSGSMLALVGLVNREGVDTAAAWQVMNQLWNYVQMPAFAVGSAVSAMAAQNIGAQKWDRIDRITLSGVAINCAMTAALVLGIHFFAEPLLRLFMPDGGPAIGISIHMNNMIGWTFILMGISMVASSVVRANGAVLFPLITLIVAAVFVRLGIGFGFYPRYGADAIWWGFGAASLVSLAMSIAYYYGGGWRELKKMGPLPEAAQ